MAFKDLREFFDGSLRLPIDGKTYVIPPISAEDGLWAQALLDVAVKADGGAEASEDDVAVLNDDDERNLYERMLGPVYDEMKADKIDWPSIARAGTTAYLFFTVGEEAAQSFWQSGSSGEAQGPNREQRRSSRTTSSRSGRSTKTAGSRAGTTSRNRKVG